MKAIIGDIHGCREKLEKLINKLIKNFSIDEFIFIGDLIDRGNESYDVIDFLMYLKAHFNVTMLKGNHEDMMLDYIFNIGKYDKNRWLVKNGGQKTLIQFYKRKYEEFDNNKINRDNLFTEEFKSVFKKIFKIELEFLNKSILYKVIETPPHTFFISHAGIENPDISPFEQKEDDYLWTRKILNRKIDNYIFVHGHTPTLLLNELFPDIESCDKAYINKDRNNNIISINIDTGCVYDGFLTAMIIDDNGSFDFVYV